MPALRLLSPELVERILDEAFVLLLQPGIRVQNPEALDLLQSAGAQVDRDQEVAHIPEDLVRRALSTVPHTFELYDAAGQARVFYGGESVQFDPGSAAVHVLDPDTGEHRPAVTADLVRLVKVAEVLPEFDAQSTALVCSDVPGEIGDLYRLYLVLLHSRKPIVTGAFDLSTLGIMLEMLAAAGADAAARKPRVIFDVCPSPPLNWTHFAAGNLLTLARAGVPAEIVSMPLAGATAPATLAGAVVQHAAECLSGLVIHQLAGAGAPIVWGGAAAIFDMRHGTTPFGAMETAMIAAAYSQVGQHLGLPTHAYLCASDSKTLDAQAGMESGMTALVGALAGLNMISGAGILDFLACQSVEKLVIDAEAIADVRRLLAGIEPRGESLAAELFADLGHSANFLGHRHTRQWFKAEQRLPPPLVDRQAMRPSAPAGRADMAARAKVRVAELLSQYRAAEQHDAAELRRIVESAARHAGLDRLPVLADPSDTTQFDNSSQTH